MSGNFYPDTISELVPWGTNFMTQMDNYASVLGIPANEKTSLTTAWAVYLDSQTQADDTTLRTQITIDEATRLRKLAIEAIRRVKNGYIDPGLKLGKINDVDYRSFGLTRPDHIHTPQGDPTDHVAFEFALDPESHRVTIKFHIEGSSKRSKGHYHAAEIRYWLRALADPGPANAEEDGWHSEADTASPWYKDFINDAGKRLWVVMRWENSATGTRGKGPWSAFQNVIIP